MFAPISQDEFRAASDEATRLVQRYADRSAMPFIGAALITQVRSWLVR